MNEQIFLLILLIAALAATVGLYCLKSKKQVQYKGDERWKFIQLKANNIANLSANAALLIFLLVASFLWDSQTTFTLQRVNIFALLYIGGLNLLELAATVYFDRQF